MKHVQDKWLRRLLRAEVKKAGSQFKLAIDREIKQQHISDALTGRDKIRPSVARAVRYKPKRVWVKV